MTHKTMAIKAQSETLVSAKAGLCNGEGICFMGSSPKSGPGNPQGVVARSLCAAGTRPRWLRALRAARVGREHSKSVNRP